MIMRPNLLVPKIEQKGECTEMTLYLCHIGTMALYRSIGIGMLHYTSRGFCGGSFPPTH